MEHELDVLFRCAIGADSFTTNVANRPRFAALEPKTDALIRIAALVTLGAPQALCRTTIAAAVEAGACDEDVVATLLTVATIVGHSRVASAAPAIALGIGYEIDDALQS